MDEKPREDPITMRPATGRVSRAKKGACVYPCEICQPPKARLVQLCKLTWINRANNESRCLPGRSTFGTELEKTLLGRD